MEVIQVFGCDSPTLNSSKGDPGNVSGAGAVKCLVAAIKVNTNLSVFGFHYVC